MGELIALLQALAGYEGTASWQGWEGRGKKGAQMEGRETGGGEGDRNLFHCSFSNLSSMVCL